MYVHAEQSVSSSNSPPFPLTWLHMHRQRHMHAPAMELGTLV